MTVRDQRSHAPFRHRTLHGQVTDYLGGRIVAGEYPPDTVLPNETELCAQLGISRNGLREVVKALAAKGMVEARPKTGTRVRPRIEWNLLDPDVLTWQQHAPRKAFLLNLTEVRRLLEPGAAELAAERASQTDLDALAAAYAEMEAGVAEGSDPGLDRFLDADLAFHRTLLRASRNEMLEQLGHVVALAMHGSMDTTARLPGAAESSLPLHRAALDAVRSGDGTAAADAMRRLMDLTSTDLRRAEEADAQ